jgi:hypothetical protein
MRRLGTAFMALGAFVGVATGLAVLTGADVPGVGSWLVAVAVAKLGFIASFALIGAGAVMHRVGSRVSRDTDVARIAEMVEPLEVQQPLGAGSPPVEPVQRPDLAATERERHL